MDFNDIFFSRGGLASEEEAHDNKFGGGSHFQLKRLENWQDQQQQLQQQILINPSLLRVPVFDIKQEDAHSSQVYGTHRNVADEFQTSSRPNSWSQVVMGVSSSPRSTVTTTTSSSSNILDFSSNNKEDGRIQFPDHSPEVREREREYRKKLVLLKFSNSVLQNIFQKLTWLINL